MQRGSASRFALRSLFASCGMFRRETPSRPRIPCVYGLEVGGRRRTWSIGIRVPFAVSRFARKARYFGMDGERGCCGGFSLLLFRGFAAKSALLWKGRATRSNRCSVPVAFLECFLRYKLPSAYLRERLLVLHLQLLFQGGVKFPTGGKSGGAKGVPWCRRGACDRADESATRVCVGSHAG